MAGRCDQARDRSSPPSGDERADGMVANAWMRSVPWPVRIISDTLAKMTGKPNLECRFYRTRAGSEPVRDWLKNLEKDVRIAVGSDIERVQWTWPVSKPLVDGFGHGLYEVRTALGGSIYRVLFCCAEGEMVLLHGFQKKTRKTAQADIDLARARMAEVKTEWASADRRQRGKSS